uniref:Glycogen debranching enzyme n=1 Tax=Aceria tosichella TaxID=561515 RepID=A0A6G1SGX7_9ACAR
MNKYIIINSGENLEDNLFIVAKRTTLTLRPGPRFQALNVTVRTNYPLKKGAKFSRQQYHEVPILTDHQDSISSSFNWHSSLKLEISGTFHFKCYSNDEVIWRAYILVDPEIKVPIDKIRCQTVLSKNLGPFKEWRKRLSLAKDLKYNMVHFTPVQELGGSNSAYALRNQHKVNPTFKASLDDIKKEVDYMDKKLCILSITDVVLNHTADDSGWIKEHPESAYNMVNSPYLRPAFLLDSAFIWLTQDMISGALAKTDNLTAEINTETEVNTIRVLLKTYYVPALKIHEFFSVDVKATLDKFSSLNRSSSLVLNNDLHERFGARVVSIPTSVKTQAELKDLLDKENLRVKNEMKVLLDGAIENAINAIKYERLNPAGPYYGKPITADMPLVAPYFSHSPLDEFKINREEKLMMSSGQQFMAHNGWVMGATGMENFAGPQSQVYLKRELIAWGDCIKLRYGDGPKDAPYLWDFMRKYVESQAKVFHGLRIDNCHSTPLHVAEYMIDAARIIRPDIYIMAELFTSSEATDNIFVNRLGITALIRESMSAHNSRELGRLMYRFGGTPVGAFYHHGEEHLRPSVAHAIFYDQTHDNESPIVARSAHDVPATTAIISMANCATGSTRGYDELVPHHINVVSETRLYPTEIDIENSGIMPLRRLLNDQLQRKLADGFSEIFVDQVNDDVIAITRHNPVDGRSIVLVARTCFTKELRGCLIRPISIQGKVARVLFEAQAYGDPDKYLPDDKFINGLSSFRTKIFNANAEPNTCKLAKVVELEEDRAEIQFNEFQFLPSSVIAVEICLTQRQVEALKVINEWRFDAESFDLTLSDVNYILFRCANEDGLEPYELPNFTKFTYAGLYGLMYYLDKVRDNQDQAHPLAMNLREGPWLGEYIVRRLVSRPSAKALGEHLELALKQVDLLPRGMVPKYFDIILTQTYKSLLEFTYSRMSVFVSKGPKLVKLLAMSSVALVGECKSAPMPEVETKLPYVPSIAAGLPHFASGFMRNWGRDTFIALRGLLLITGRFSEAKAIILSYGRTLKNGLIPNLLDGGNNSRYNCRDAIWWWLYSIREYTKFAPNGNEILRCKVKRIHKPAISLPQRKKSQVQQANGLGDTCTQQLVDLIQESLECHFRGMEFVEERAGKQLDEHMQEKGFTVTFGVDRETGFVYGGNRYNCGTWMDKMGSSEKAKTKGLPASPRDGSAVEIVGLCKAVVSWLDELYKNNRIYPYDGVESLYDNTITLKWSWKKWNTMIQANFEKHFYIPMANEGENSVPDPNPKCIFRRGIYKDTVGASLEWQDYQLRPNFLVAMVVAPEMFNASHAKLALEQVKQHLCGPLGMKTLDPADWAYNGDYDNDNDTSDAKLAHGYNYHQGPEWLWPTGFYIRASSKFVGASERSHHLKILSNFYTQLVGTPWLGLPELTNTNGHFCPGSCPIQAWSLGTALEALFESSRSN